jgi:zinc-binding alcohol dehydrogenase/oxidoreductase
MKCIVHQGDGLEGARYADLEVPALGRDDVLVRLKAAALNHRDIWTCLGRTADAPAVVLGSDGAGVIEQVGEAVADIAVGTEVVVNSSQDWLSRGQVPQGEYNVGYKILGHPDHGTFAEYLAIARNNVEPKPAHLDWEEAAALPLVGLTTYRALFTEGRLKAGQTVAIPGIGGGAACQALLFAKQAGAKVVVTSRSGAKLDKARALGADLTLSTESDWAAAVRDFTDGAGADIVIETIGRATWNNSIGCLANGGRLVVFGATSDGVVEVDLASLFLHWQTIVGTTMGSREEFRDMLTFVEAYEIGSVLDRSFALEDGVEALRYLDSAEQMGKVILSIAL